MCTISVTVLVLYICMYMCIYIYIYIYILCVYDKHKSICIVNQRNKMITIFKFFVKLTCSSSKVLCKFYQLLNPPSSRCTLLH